MLKSIIALLLVTWALLPPTIWLIKFLLPKKPHGCLIFVMTCFAGYGLFIGCAYVADIQATRHMESFDLDGDGDIDGAEMTSDAQKAMDDWASDTGRTMAIFTGIPLTLIWYTIWFAPLYGAEWLFRALKKSGPPESPTTPPENPRPLPPDEDGNPYKPSRQ